LCRSHSAVEAATATRPSARSRRGHLQDERAAHQQTLSLSMNRLQATDPGPAGRARSMEAPNTGKSTQRALSKKPDLPIGVPGRKQEAGAGAGRGAGEGRLVQIRGGRAQGSADDAADQDAGSTRAAARGRKGRDGGGERRKRRRRARATQ
jgi:hypothetical protein